MGNHKNRQEEDVDRVKEKYAVLMDCEERHNCYNNRALRSHSSLVKS